MTEKWYNSTFGVFAGIAAIVAAVGYGAGSAGFTSSEEVQAKKTIELARIQKGYELQTGDINGNGIPDKFYVIDGKVAVVELDGKPVVSGLDAKVLQK